VKLLTQTTKQHLEHMKRKPWLPKRAATLCAAFIAVAAQAADKQPNILYFHQTSPRHQGPRGST
jgi:hypothetical protein